MRPLRWNVELSLAETLQTALQQISNNNNNNNNNIRYICKCVMLRTRAHIIIYNIVGRYIVQLDKNDVWHNIIIYCYITVVVYMEYIAKTTVRDVQEKFCIMTCYIIPCRHVFEDESSGSSSIGSRRRRAVATNSFRYLFLIVIIFVLLAEMRHRRRWLENPQKTVSGFSFWTRENGFRFH